MTTGRMEELLSGVERGPIALYHVSHCFSRPGTEKGIVPSLISEGEMEEDISKVGAGLKMKLR